MVCRSCFLCCLPQVVDAGNIVEAVKIADNSSVLCPAAILIVFKRTGIDMDGRFRGEEIVGHIGRGKGLDVGIGDWRAVEGPLLKFLQSRAEDYL